MTVLYVSAHILRSSKGSTQSSLNRLPDEAKLDREHLRELCHEIQQRLSASVQSKPSDHLGLKTVFSNPFVNPKKAATLLDICVGGVDHINLKQVVSYLKITLKSLILARH